MHKEVLKNICLLGYESKDEIAQKHYKIKCS
jgi:hypothetical protein